MKKREEYLMKLYWTLWQSADFENDFAEDWNAVYRKLSNGNHYSIPMVVIEMCFQYLQEWTKKHGNV
jgi:hypothetical protein